MDTFIDFPVILGTENRIFEDNWSVVQGVIYFYPLQNSCFNLAYIIDTSKPWTDPGYFRFQSEEERQVFVAIEEKSAKLSDKANKTIVVKENTDFIIIEIAGTGTVPVSTLKSPAGKEYTSSVAVDNVLFSQQPGGKKDFWSLLAPQKGNWVISLVNPGVNDSIIIYSQPGKSDFNYSVSQNGRNISVTWNPALTDSGQVVNIMFDKDTIGFNGFPVAKGNAKTGSLSFTLDDAYTDCTYHLYAQLADSFQINQSYSKYVIDNHLASLPPPENFSVNYNKGTGAFDFTWVTNPSAEVDGYVLSINDEAGIDSIYAVLDRNTTGTSLFIDDIEKKYAKIESFKLDGKIGCASLPVSLLTGTDDLFQLKDPATRLKIYPNPTSGKCTIRYFVTNDSRCDISLFDINGREIAHPVAGHQSAGFHQVDFDYGNLAEGIYLIRFINNMESFTLKSIFK